ncbi:hypothetical protein [Pseudanabaena sp. PCC 6802]|uniref:hypothetical protein n=1 Tax=Pseudanabaena sp. PCC 6802 TaxID=118173 RepID=UPI000348E2DC|nr:hypothetical protein [Pseudanabaena sp. PCC 6802]
MYIEKVARRIEGILAAPETNLFLFGFLLHFVYEVWQSPYFEFYRMPTLADKVSYITHCTVGDGVITVISGGVVSWVDRSRSWILRPTWRAMILFTSLGWFYTFISEIYRIRIAKLYGVSTLVVPIVEISWLPLLQWIIIPPLVLYMSRKHILGYQKNRSS